MPDRTCPPCHHNCQQGDTCPAWLAKSAAPVDGGPWAWLEQVKAWAVFLVCLFAVVAIAAGIAGTLTGYWPRLISRVFA